MTQPRFYIRWIFHDQSLSPGNPSSKMQLLVWPVQRAKGKHLTLEILHSLSAWGWPSVKQDCGRLLIDLLEEKEKTSENGSYTTGLWDVLLLAHLASCVCMLSRFSCVYLYAMLWTAAHQAPLSMGFSRQEYWSGVPLPSLVQGRPGVIHLKVPLYMSCSLRFSPFLLTSLEVGSHSPVLQMASLRLTENVKFPGSDVFPLHSAKANRQLHFT